MMGSYFCGETSIGIDKCCNLDCDNWDNGTYVIKGWKIVGRKYFENSEQNNHDLEDMLFDINETQPEGERLSRIVILEAVKGANSDDL